MSTYLEDKYPRWFVYDSYTPAGRPKLEDALMTWAKLQYLHTIIAEDQLKSVVDRILDKQDELWNENKRRKKVDVSLSRRDHFENTVRWLYIGAQHLALRKVRDEIE